MSKARSSHAWKSAVGTKRQLHLPTKGTARTTDISAQTAKPHAPLLNSWFSLAKYSVVAETEPTDIFSTGYGLKLGMINQGGRLY